MTDLVTLNDIPLPLVIEERPDIFHSNVRSVVVESLSGTPIIFEESSAIIGTYIDLVGSENRGWVRASVLKQLNVLASIPRGTFTLDYNGLVYTVRFRNEDPPVIMAEPLKNPVDMQDTQYFNNVRLKLMIL